MQRRVAGTDLQPHAVRLLPHQSESPDAIKDGPKCQRDASNENHVRATKPLINAESQKGAHANLQGRKSGENEKEQAADQETGLGTLLGLEAPILLTVPTVPTPRTELAKQHPQREWAQTGWVSVQQGNRMVDAPI